MAEFLKSIIEPLHESASVTRVYGEPVSAHGRTVIPVARIRYGFGGGAGHGSRPGQTLAGEGQGEGGGGGVMAAPVGVIEISEERTRFVPLNSHSGLAMAGIAGLFLGMLFGRRRRG